MAHRRESRLNEQLKREISLILARKVRDPRVGGVLVTGVRVTQDLWLARVFVRPLEGARTMEEMLAGLAAAAPFIRRELGRILRMRRIPELRFLHDTTLDSALRIEEVLKEVLPPEERVMEEGGGEEEAEADADKDEGGPGVGGSG